MTCRLEFPVDHLVTITSVHIKNPTLTNTLFALRGLWGIVGDNVNLCDLREGQGGLMLVDIPPLICCLFLINEQQYQLYSNHPGCGYSLDEKSITQYTPSDKREYTIPNTKLKILWTDK